MRCDGCGRTVGDEHIRERIARLELATRFRPIHINLLLLASAPPPALNDYFYRPARNPAERSAESRALFTELMLGAGIPWDSSHGEEAALTEFQHRGYFLAYCCECPLADFKGGETAIAGEERAAEEVRRLGATIVQRIRFSYKPKKIALIAPATREVIPLVEQAGLKDSLILDNGNPFIDFSPASRPARADLRSSLGDQLRKAVGGGP